VSDREPSIRHGVFLRCAIYNRAGMAPGWPTHTRSEQLHRCALGKPACTWFSGRYGQRMPLQLRFFAIALQPKVHNAVQYFYLGPHFVPKRDIKKWSFKDSLPMNLQYLVCRCIIFHRSLLLKNPQKTQSLESRLSSFPSLLKDFATLSFGRIERFLGLFWMNPCRKLNRKNDTLEFLRAYFSTLRTKSIARQKRPSNQMKNKKQ